MNNALARGLELWSSKIVDISEPPSSLRAKIEWRVARASIPIPEEQMASSKISYNFFRNVLSRLVC